MGFFLFILVNATLFIRPREMFGIEELDNVYQVLILASLAVSVPDILNHLFGRPLDAQPISLCVFGIMLMVPLAFLASFKFAEALEAELAFVKVVIYYLLLVSLVNTSQRLRVFLGCVLLFCTVLALLSVLNIHGVIRLQSIRILTDRVVDRVTGETRGNDRLEGTGIFGDPNEMCVVLATLLTLALYSVSDRSAVLKIVGFVALMVYAYAIVLTRSRGGLLALMSGLGVLGFNRLGLWKTALLGVFGLALLALVGDERQKEISFKTDTAQTRMELWSDWMMTFRGSPFLGEGMWLPKSGETERSPWDGYAQVAHNSYLQAFADLGFLGGVFFLGAYYLALASIKRLGSPGIIVLDPDMRRLQPFLMGAATAYAVGILTLSLCYAIPTYLILGLATAYTRITVTYPPVPLLRLDGKIILRCFALAVIFLIWLYGLLQVMKSMGVL